MMYKTMTALCIFFLHTACSNKEAVAPGTVDLPVTLDSKATYNYLVFGIRTNLIESAVEKPNELGALGRNKNGYFHVRFQLNMTRISDYAIASQNKAAVTAYLQNLQYSFSFQKPVGDFQLIVPDALRTSPDYQAPSQGDLASGTAFFAYSVAISLNSLEYSNWYKGDVALSEARQQIDALKPKIRKMLGYLKSKEDVLVAIDRKAPNRLLFNAIAFYGLGIYLGDEQAKKIGLWFAQEAMAQTNPDEGYFIEGGGWDSSYNGVAGKLGFELFTMLDARQHPLLKEQLGEVLLAATDWQKSRILANGEITTASNTRVFSGGEKFLGNEKAVDVIKTVKAFFYRSKLTNDASFEELGLKIIKFYE